MFTLEHFFIVETTSIPNASIGTTLTEGFLHGKEHTLHSLQEPAPNATAK